MVSRIAIVNRGEAAVRLIHAVRDLNARPVAGVEPIRTIALHTDVDAGSAFVREADESYLLGAAADRPYLDLAVLERALVESGADAAWVGWGFVAEDPAFAELCARLGVTFIGPSAEAMRKLGDKIGSKLIAEEVGVPVAPWSRGGVHTLEEALASADEVGYPLMLKATAGGGGRGIRKVTSPAELTDAYQRTRDEAERAFGSGIVFLEKLVTDARHVEVQVIADGQGTAWAIGVRDCSVQRRNQKVIEESASPLLEDAQTQDLKASAERLANAVGYAGAGTVEFLYHPGERTFAFLEVNTRLQVEHPITEEVTGTDLVALQIQVARGIPLAGDRPSERGHAVEARLNAEDPDRDFAPAPGRISRLELPSGPGIRVDTGVTEGDTIPADFDSMIAKVIAWGADREQALARLRRAMGETTVVIDGGATNKSFILDLLDQPEVLSGDPVWADTGWIDRVRGEGRLQAARHSGVALVAAAIEAYLEEERAEIARFLQTAQGGRPQAQHDPSRSIELKLRGAAYALTVRQTGPAQYDVTIGAAGAAEERTVTAVLDRLDDVHGRLTVDGHRYRLVTSTHGTVMLVEVDDVMHRVSRDEGGMVRSPAPALVVATPVAVGDEVTAGSPVLVLESMKMETVLHAPFTGRIKELVVRVGSQVETGAPLVRLDPTGDGDEVAGTASYDDLDLPEPMAAAAADCVGSLTGQLLGYDVAPDQRGTVLADHLATRTAAAREAETALLSLFTDFAELSRNRPAGDEHTELRVHSSREHFHTYLRSLDPERGALPDHFRDKLLRVLAHYGVTDLERTPELERAVFRIFLAQQHPSDVDIAVGILQRWLGDPPPAAEDAAAARALLERMVRATQLRFAVVGDLARSIRFGWFDQPAVDVERRAVLEGVPAEVAALTDPAAADRDARIDALTAIPEPLVGFLRDRLADGLPASEPLLEVLVRRHYLEHDLHDLTVADVAGRPVVHAEYATGEKGATRVVSTIGDVTELAPGGALGAALDGAIATDHDNVVEVYLRWPDAPTDPDEASAEVARLLDGQPFVARARRVSVAVCPAAPRPIDYFTFRTDGGENGGELDEDKLVRGMHPMVGRRLNLSRLREFDVTRLDAPDDVLLYECVARTNPADRRLVAAAQVRQLAVVRDEEGRVIALPHAERAVENCLEAIRRVRTARGRAGTSLDVNHVWVTVWPVIEADLDQLTALQGKITPLTESAGIEEVLAEGRVAGPDGKPTPLAIRFHAKPGAGVVADVITPPAEPLKPMDEYAGKVLRARRRGLVYPYELESVLAGGGSLQEYDFDERGVLAPVDRPRGQNTAALIVAVVNTPTPLYPEGIKRVVLCGDPLKSLGALSEPECARVIAAIDLAEELDVPLEWFAVSAGARISMESGTENMDWVADALRRIVEFTQDGGEINIVVAGINVGAQPYWNAEATMLMHTKGILVMTPDSAMVLTGKQSLDFSGGVSAEDNHGIGGYDRVMGPNGQAQYWVRDLAGAFDVLMAHYEHTYVVPGEPGPRRAPTTDPVERDVTSYPHPGADFATVGQIFSAEHNPDRKKPFDIRTVMRSVADADHELLERWAGMADADTAVTVDTRIGGYPVTLIGIESKPVPRAGFPPTDGPDTYTAGTLFPRSSKKVARAINAASGNRPVVVLANLSGFDGSPESMRNLQLEYGAEIGRSIVNFRGPIVFCVVSRYHGGAFVVFSKRLNPSMTVLAIEGSYASVLGGAPAAAVVFAAEVAKRAAADPKVAELQERIDGAADGERGLLLVELAELRHQLHADKIAEIAAEFDGVHNIHRAVEVGSVDEVIAASDLRPKVIGAIEKGLS
ncbi:MULTISPECIES: carboxyl transferase domain-containing protein [unclassified Nocardioides]|uniref:ATP-binding protein n=1 Tax=unclassified Nocardioides TaxID=2615069 RepID=UPI000703BEDA|nr:MULTISPECIES: carboxyl transferase domain-containing protein [unclassified Nocardioides]KRC53836.1 fused acetyl/propionyl-CoA carboxylase subuit alpha/methylmalonyl-CoA decarboxylase subunit alpha [Nocardioides sp. Root79]KRC71171.1 fused acetyl/propionyl-CoA carboxylase subuit alpha/methylmalonyl-CoA decarboxylase subunit alpha [Nocardioides sp. Root240]